MERAYAVLECKADAVRSDVRTFSGIASTAILDRQNHVLDPDGVTFANPVVLLFHHDREKPIGTATLSRGPGGILFTATVPIVDEAGPLRDRCDEAWQSIKAGLLRGVSIGYRVLEGGIERLRGGALRLTKTEICELSLVAVPANAQATILNIKAFDTPLQAAPGRLLDHSRARGAHPMKTTTERITTLEASRQALVGRLNTLAEKTDAAGTTLEPEDAAEYDDLQLQVKGIDADLVRWRELDKLNAAAAMPVLQSATAPRLHSVQIKSNLPPGTSFARMVMAIARNGGVNHGAMEYASHTWRDTPEVALAIKAAVAPGNTTDPTWAGALVSIANVANEFLALLRPATILGKITGLRTVPFNTAVPVQTAGGSYGWVGQGKPKPVTKLGFLQAVLGMNKASGIVVLTEELVKSSSPSAETIVRGDMVAGIAAFLDVQFIDPAVAAVPDVNPASITNGIAGIPSVDPITDLQALIGSIAGQGVPIAGLTLIMSEMNAFALGLLRSATGVSTFENATAQGGSVQGFQLIASNAAGNNVIALQPSMILYADDGGVSIDVSREASVIMDSAPVDGGALTSLWQNNLVGLRAERFVNWKRGRDHAVAFVTGANYTVEVPPAGGATRTPVAPATPAGKPGPGLAK
jgi:HK97 family phage major capsid protein/HK97 family phage prohead protease